MPFKKTKNDAADALELEWVLQVKDYKLTLDKNYCVGCQICTLACPKKAISTEKQPKVKGEKAKKVKVDIDLAKCNFCGICDVTCPHGAIKVTQNGCHILSVVSKESYPQLIRDINVDTRKCDKKCVQCETTCPLNLIKVSKVGFDGKPVQDVSALSSMGQRRVQITVDIDKAHCPTCRACEFKCSPGAIRVKKAIEGKIKIDQEKCPEGCKDCLDVCPIVGTLTLGEDKKISVNELTCTYCGACKNVCPVNEALHVKRTKILHTAVHSGAWNKTLEKITSPEDAIKEFKAHAAQNRVELVEKRFAVEDMKKK